jgi:hypothetical protein
MSAVAPPGVSIEALESANIDADTFNHESHVYTAWLYLEQSQLNEASQRNARAVMVCVPPRKRRSDRECGNNSESLLQQGIVG